MIDQVDIGGISYSVKLIKRLARQDAEGKTIDLNGDIKYYETAIRLNADLNEQMQPVVMLHEIVHAVFEQAGVEDHPEPIINALSYGLVRVLKANPDLVAFLTK